MTEILLAGIEPTTLIEASPSYHKVKCTALYQRKPCCQGLHSALIPSFGVHIYIYTPNLSPGPLG